MHEHEETPESIEGAVEHLTRSTAVTSEQKFSAPSAGGRLFIESDTLPVTQPDHMAAVRPDQATGFEVISVADLPREDVDGTEWAIYKNEFIPVDAEVFIVATHENPDAQTLGVPNVVLKRNSLIMPSTLEMVFGQKTSIVVAMDAEGQLVVNRLGDDHTISVLEFGADAPSASDSATETAVASPAETFTQPEAPRSIADVLNTVDEHTAAIAEEEPRVTELDAEKIGEEVLDVVDVVDPAEAEPAPVTLAEMMSGEKQGPLKFDIEAGKERQRQEEATKLISSEALYEARMKVTHLQNQLQALMQAAPSGEVVFQRQNLEATIVGEARKAQEALRRGDADPYSTALLEGFFASSVRTTDALRALKPMVMDELHDEQEQRQIEDILGLLETRINRGGPEGGHFADFEFTVEQVASQLRERNGGEPTIGYATLIGMVMGVAGRISPSQAQHALGRIHGGLDLMGRFKK